MMIRSTAFPIASIMSAASFAYGRRNCVSKTTRRLDPSTTCVLTRKPSSPPVYVCTMASPTRLEERLPAMVAWLISPRDVDHVRERFALHVTPNVLCHDRRDPPEELRGDPGDVRRDDHLREFVQRVIARERLVVEHVQRRAGDPP